MWFSAGQDTPTFERGSAESRFPETLRHFSSDPAVVVTVYRTTKIEKYWGKP
jgi:hypothetical protein